MKSLLLVANFKSNKTIAEARVWVEEFSQQFRPIDTKEVIVCPSFTLLPSLKQYINEHNLPIKLGAQDLSSLGEGSYTGEVNTKQVKEVADFVILGHSERRINLKEDDEILKKKVQQALGTGLEIIFCIQDETTFIPQNVKVVAYEPVFAIGTGSADTPKNAQKVAIKIKERVPSVIVLYGGSVTPENVKSFTDFADINGVLVGGASLDAREFAEIVKFA